MPLRCIDGTGRNLHSFEIPAPDWIALANENRERRHLRLPCCDAQVVLKTSKLNTRFFAHKARGPCATAPESEAHLALKAMAAEAARDAGWKVTTEASGISSAGNDWVADVLAEKGRARVAVELQWSSQTDEETMRRQRRYKESGIRGLWLLRQPGFPITLDLPAVCIGGNVKQGFEALVPDSRMNARHRSQPDEWLQHMPMPRFLAAAFGGRFRFGIPENCKARVRINSGILECWRDSCKASTRIVTLINIAFGPHSCDLTVRECESFPELLASVMSAAAGRDDIGAIRRRYSGAQKQSYFSNGCSKCGALIGEFYEHDAYDHAPMVLAEFGVDLTGEWYKAVARSQRCNYGWAIYET